MVSVTKLVPKKDVMGFYVIDIDWQAAFEICGVLIGSLSKYALIFMLNV